jgi:hypothetical protein
MWMLLECISRDLFPIFHVWLCGSEYIFSHIYSIIIIYVWLWSWRFPLISILSHTTQYSNKINWLATLNHKCSWTSLTNLSILSSSTYCTYLCELDRRCPITQVLYLLVFSLWCVLRVHVFDLRYMQFSQQVSIWVVYLKAWILARIPACIS